VFKYFLLILSLKSPNLFVISSVKMNLSQSQSKKLVFISVKGLVEYSEKR